MTRDVAVWDRLAAALEYPVGAAAALQEAYVNAFDLDPASTLDVGWHLFGDSPERGAFLSILREDLARSGVCEDGNLPDHLPTLLRLIPREDEDSAAALAATIRPAVERVIDRLKTRDSPFVAPLDEAARLLDECRRHEEHL